VHLASRANGAAAVQGDMAGGCQLGFCVEDVEACHQEMVARGTLCLQPPTEAAFGAKHAVYADPDGLPFWVTGRRKEVATDPSLHGSDRGSGSC
jgi:hypothetical protein